MVETLGLRYDSLWVFHTVKVVLVDVSYCHCDSKWVRHVVIYRPIISELSYHNITVIVSL